MAMGAAFALGWFAGGNAVNRKAYADLWEAMPYLPDPAQCALCGEGISYHAPCLLDLSTGQMGELKVYDPHPSLEGEIAPMELQQTGTFNFQVCAGLTGVRNTANHTFQVTLSKDKTLMNPALFCGDCRRLLADAVLEGYVIADLYDMANIRVYPVQRGRDAVIRDYRVSVIGRQGAALEICVTGLL